MTDSDEDDDLQPNKTREVYYPIRPEGPITGAIWERGKWVHVGCGRKRKRFDDDDNEDNPNTHTNLRNPKKRARFIMKVEQSEIEHLTHTVKRTKPPRHLNPVALLQATELKNKFEQQSKSKAASKAASVVHPQGFDAAMDILSLSGNFKVSSTFDDLPISQYTKHCLFVQGFKYLTDIQKAAIPHALVGRDVLGAAKTGSGKTLAFVIPVLENLYRKAWNRGLGLGALMLAPTRELALQIFKNIRLIGRRIRHLSAGLLIGGKHSLFEDEKKVIHKMSIIVGTPGRTLAHFEGANSNFNVNQLQMLVLDEADLMLDIGLLDQVQKIMDYLPRKRQTMLFSATLTIDIVKLAKVSLRRPVFLPIDTSDACALPKELVQTYIVTPLQHKYNLLWSFIQTHINDKIIVFFATLRQVKFTRRVFVKLRPYSSIVCLHSEMRQNKRMEMYQMFKRLKSRAILLCTEVASRGLDFGNVDWVINFDVPADTRAYIHRVGRAARLGQKGNSITFLSDNETGFIKELKAVNINCKKLGIHTKHLKPIIGAFQTILSKDQRMMELAQKAFNSYLAFYYFHGNKNYMDPSALNKDDLAKMFGLMHTPKYKKFLKKCKSHKLCTMPHELKLLLLDNKKKRQQKSDLIKMMADKQQQQQQREQHNCNNNASSGHTNNYDLDKDEDAPTWFKDAFRDPETKEDSKEEENDKHEKNEDMDDVNEWLESESEENENDDDNDRAEMNDDDIEMKALQAINDRA